LYFQPELFSNVNSLDLPAFSIPGSGVSVVYKQRKLLEAPDIKLGQWIDLIFGVAQKDSVFHPYLLDNVWRDSFDREKDDIISVMKCYGLMPVQLFTQPHPERPSFEPMTPQFYTPSCPGSLLFVCRMDRELWTVDSSGRLLSFEINLAFKQMSSTATPVTKTASFGVLSGGLIAYDRRQLVTVTKSKVTTQPFEEVDWLMASGDRFVTIRDRSVLKLYDRSSADRRAMLVMTEDLVQCYAVSAIFHLLCVATRDDKLRYYSLRRLRQTQVVQMPLATAKSLRISDAWGFVVVGFEKEFLVFTVNGELVTKYEHEVENLYWSMVTSRDDFDFIVMCDIRGKLVLVEAADPETRKVLTTVGWPVSFVDYEKQADILLVVSQTGKVMLITHPFDVGECQQ
jgi:hypothetical protein